MTSAGCESFKGSLWTLDLMMYLDLKCLECSKVLKRGETDIIVSASREFKEMLKAAFVTPYKFYDGDAITTTRDASLENTSSSEVHQNTNPALSTGPGRVEQRVIDQQKQIMLKRWSFWQALQNPDINVHDIYSALVGLFDAGDEIMSVDPAPGSANPVVAESAERASPVNETAISEDEQLIETESSSPGKRSDIVQNDNLTTLFA